MKNTHISQTNSNIPKTTIPETILIAISEITSSRAFKRVATLLGYLYYSSGDMA